MPGVLQGDTLTNWKQNKLNENEQEQRAGRCLDALKLWLNKFYGGFSLYASRSEPIGRVQPRLKGNSIIGPCHCNSRSISGCMR
jgi:hypothetical protein